MTTIATKARGREDDLVVLLLLTALLLSGFAKISAVVFACGLLVFAGVVVSRWSLYWRTGRFAFFLATALVVSGLLVGSFQLSPEFLAEEGRSVSGAIVLGGIGLFAVSSSRMVQVLLRTVAAVGVLSLLLLVSPARSLVVDGSGEGVFVGFGSSHHATAFLFGILAPIAWGNPHVSRTEGRLLAVTMSGVALATTSRTLLIAILVAMVISAWAVGVPKPYRSLVGRRAAVCLAFGALVFALPIVRASPICDGCASGSALGLPSVSTLIETSRFDDADAALTDPLPFSSASGREANVLLRVRAWERALTDVGRSPFVGVGAFRFNDENRRFLSPAPLVSVVTDASEVTADFGAHNVYLQVASELGLLGLFTLLSALWVAGRTLTRNETSVVRVAAMLAFVWSLGLVSNSVLSPAVSVALLVAGALASAPTQDEVEGAKRLLASQGANGS